MKPQNLNPVKPLTKMVNLDAKAVQALKILKSLKRRWELIRFRMGKN